MVGVSLVGIRGLISLATVGHLPYTGLGDGVRRPVSLTLGKEKVGLDGPDMEL